MIRINLLPKEEKAPRQVAISFKAGDMVVPAVLLVTSALVIAGMALSQYSRATSLARTGSPNSSHLFATESNVIAAYPANPMSRASDALSSSTASASRPCRNNAAARALRARVAVPHRS